MNEYECMMETIKILEGRVKLLEQELFRHKAITTYCPHTVI